MNNFGRCNKPAGCVYNDMLAPIKKNTRDTFEVKHADNEKKKDTTAVQQYAGNRITTTNMLHGVSNSSVHGKCDMGVHKRYFSSLSA